MHVTSTGGGVFSFALFGDAALNFLSAVPAQLAGNSIACPSVCLPGGSGTRRSLLFFRLLTSENERASYHRGR